MKKITCHRCGKEFSAKRSSRMYCDTCKIIRNREKANRYRNKKNEPKPTTKIELCSKCGREFIKYIHSNAKVCEFCVPIKKAEFIRMNPMDKHNIDYSKHEYIFRT